MDTEKNLDSDEKSEPYQPTPPPLPIRSLRDVLILSIVPGGGQVYSDKAKRGVFYFFGAIVIMLTGILFKGLNYTIISTIIWSTLGAFLLWVFIESVWLVKRYNKFVRKNLRAPKEDEKW